MTTVKDCTLIYMLESFLVDDSEQIFSIVFAYRQMLCLSFFYYFQHIAHDGSDLCGIDYVAPVYSSKARRG